MANCFKCRNLEEVYIKWRCKAGEGTFNGPEAPLMANIRYDYSDPDERDRRELKFAACYDYAKAEKLGHVFSYSDAVEAPQDAAAEKPKGTTPE